jgi:hypothetical protein
VIEEVLDPRYLAVAHGEDCRDARSHLDAACDPLPGSPRPLRPPSAFKTTPQYSQLLKVERGLFAQPTPVAYPSPSVPVAAPYDGLLLGPRPEP